MPFRCRQPVHEHLIRRTPRRARRIQGPLQGRTDPRPRPGTVAHDRGRRAGHPRLGSLVQHRPDPQLPRRHLARRVRGRLRYFSDRPAAGWNPMKRACARPGTDQNPHLECLESGIPRDHCEEPAHVRAPSPDPPGVRPQPIRHFDDPLQSRTARRAPRRARSESSRRRRGVRR